MFRGPRDVANSRRFLVTALGTWPLIKTGDSLAPRDRKILERNQEQDTSSRVISDI